MVLQQLTSNPLFCLRWLSMPIRARWTKAVWARRGCACIATSGIWESDRSAWIIAFASVKVAEVWALKGHGWAMPSCRLTSTCPTVSNNHNREDLTVGGVGEDRNKNGVKERMQLWRYINVLSASPAAAEGHNEARGRGRSKAFPFGLLHPSSFWWHRTNHPILPIVLIFSFLSLRGKWSLTM